jgi:hypothetical protein
MLRRHAAPPGASLFKGGSAIEFDGDMAACYGAECIIGPILIQNCFMVGQNVPLNLNCISELETADDIIWKDYTQDVRKRVF